MANIHCTKKLERLIGKQHIHHEPEKPGLLGTWNANIFPIHGRKNLLLANEDTYYGLLFLDIKKKDILNLQERFYERLLEQWEYDGLPIPNTRLFQLKAELEPRFLSTNNNRRLLGVMREYVFNVEVVMALDYDSLDQVNLPLMNNKLSTDLVSPLGDKTSSFGSYGHPVDAMRNRLLELGG